MFRKFLSDFHHLTDPASYPDSIQPYLSMILTIVTVTVVAYWIQTITTSIYVYAATPSNLHSNVLQKEECNNFAKATLHYLCESVGRSNRILLPYPSPTMSLTEQDTHILTN